MEKIVAEYYEVYRKWFERSLEIIWRLPPELLTKANPMAQLEIFEKQSPKIAAKALTESIGDTVAMTDRYSKDDIETADSLFGRDNLPTLTSVRAIFSRKVLKIMKSGSLRSDDDYYVIKSLEDCDLPQALRERIEHLLGSYEVESR